MGEFVLRPAKIILTRLAADPEKPEERLSFSELVRKFAPRNPAERMKLGLLKRGSFIGTTMGLRDPESRNIFVLLTNGGPGELAHVLKKDPSLLARITSAYRIEETGYEGSVAEQEGRIDADLHP